MKNDARGFGIHFPVPAPRPEGDLLCPEAVQRRDHASRLRASPRAICGRAQTEISIYVPHGITRNGRRRLKSVGSHPRCAIFLAHPASIVVRYLEDGTVNRRLRLITVIAVVAVMVGFAETRIAWAQTPGPTPEIPPIAVTGRHCTATVGPTDIEAGVNGNLGIDLKWFFTAKPGLAGVTPDGRQSNDPHVETVDLIFVITISQARYVDSGTNAVTDLTDMVTGFFFNLPLPVRKARAERVTVDTQRKGSRKYSLQGVEEVALSALLDAGAIPAPTPNQKFELPPGTTYTFYPVIAISHDAGPAAGWELTDADGDLLVDGTSDSFTTSRRFADSYFVDFPGLPLAR